MVVILPIGLDMREQHRSPIASELLDTGPAAEYLGIRGHTLEVWRTSGRYGLPFVKVGRRVKYRRADLDRFLAARTVGTFEAEGA
jgi:excisionase family DNA binding protein